MNKPAKIVAEPPIDCPDYPKDGYGWAMAQAAIIRAGRLDSSEVFELEIPRPESD